MIRQRILYVILNAEKRLRKACHAFNYNSWVFSVMVVLVFSIYNLWCEKDRNSMGQNNIYAVIYGSFISDCTCFS